MRLEFGLVLLIGLNCVDRRQLGSVRFLMWVNFVLEWNGFGVRIAYGSASEMRMSPSSERAVDMFGSAILVLLVSSLHRSMSSDLMGTVQMELKGL